MLDSAISTPTHLQMSFLRYLYILVLVQQSLKLNILKWRDCLDHEAAFCYQKFSVSLNLNWDLGHTMKSILTSGSGLKSHQKQFLML